VEQKIWDLLLCCDRGERLNEEIQKLQNPVYLVAHSFGCLMVIYWAQNYSSENIRGAFLLAPADAESSQNLSFVKGFDPIPGTLFAFKSVVIASTNDHYASIERTAEFVYAWVSVLIYIGVKGHINANSSIGNWPYGQTQLEDFVGFINQK